MTEFACVALDHNRINCKAAGRDMLHSCLSCWIQRAPEWDADHARKLIKDELILEALDEEVEEEQIQAGVAFLQEQWQEQMAARYLGNLKEDGP